MPGPPAARLPRLPIGRGAAPLSARRAVHPYGWAQPYGSGVEPRLRALCDLSVAESREYAGRHEYDGRLQDLSPAGVTAALGRLGRQAGEALADGHDEAHLTAFEEGARVAYGELALHRALPGLHVANLDLACYDRAYAPEPERARARAQHLAGWPDAVDAALEALDRVPREVALGTLASVRGLAEGVEDEQALAAHARLVAHVERASREGEADPALGAPALARLMGVPEGLEVDLGRLAEQADRERDRLTALLGDACERIAPGVPVAETRLALERDHPDADGVLREARALTEEVVAWVAASGLVPYPDGECRVGPAPGSRSSTMASLSWAAPGEPEGPSWYYVTPPDPTWPEQDQQEWLGVFSRATLPAVTLHEVAPGHFTHGRALRHVASPVRRTLFSSAFVEGWAHYAEEMALEEGFREGDPHVQAGVAVEALIRVTRLACALGVHTGAMTVAEAAARFTADTGTHGSAALSEARRATWDPTYGRYTWGKLEILRWRERALARPGSTLAGFHRDLLALGAPPLGLLGAVLD